MCVRKDMIGGTIKEYQALRTEGAVDRWVRRSTQLALATEGSGYQMVLASCVPSLTLRPVHNSLPLKVFPTFGWLSSCSLLEK